MVFNKHSSHGLICAFFLEGHLCNFNIIRKRLSVNDLKQIRFRFLIIIMKHFLFSSYQTKIAASKPNADSGDMESLITSELVSCWQAVLYII